MAQETPQQNTSPLSPTIPSSSSSINTTTTLQPSASDLASSPLRPPSTDRLSIPFALRLPLTTFLGAVTGLALGMTQGATMSGLRFRAENAHRLPTSQVGWYLYHKSKNYAALLGGVKEGLRMAARVGLWTGVFFGVEEAVDRLRGALVRRLYLFKERRRGAVVVGGAPPAFASVSASTSASTSARFAHPALDHHNHHDDVDDVDERDERELGIERVGDGSKEPILWVQRDFVSTVVAALGTAGAFSAWNRLPVPTAARTALMGLKFGLGFGLVQDAVGLMRGRRLGYVEFVKRNLFGIRDDARAKAVFSAT